jgi:hypothetical protein
MTNKLDLSKSIRKNKLSKDLGALFFKIMACHFLYIKKLICKESGMP